jgi:uncharacterized protein
VSESLAAQLVAHRDEHGPYATRTALNAVRGLGPKAFEQCAGFLRIRGGADPLDVSGVHPEAYPVVRRILDAAKVEITDLLGNAPKIKSLKPQRFVDDRFGLPTVTDILAELEKPGRDPRPAFRTATFAEGVHRISDLRVGMLLEGQVTNVAAFGAFVDVGVHQDGLVHVSALSKDYVSDPREVVKSGDVVRVKVLAVDEERKRISLTLRLDDEPPAGGGRPPRGARGGAGEPGTREQPGRERGGRARGQGDRDRGGRNPGGGGQGGGAQGGGDQAGRGRKGREQPAGRPDRTPRGGDPKGRGGAARGSSGGSGGGIGNSAMADALKRAGLAGGDGKG